jgi:serine protease AprX
MKHLARAGVLTLALSTVTLSTVGVSVAPAAHALAGAPTESVIVGAASITAAANAVVAVGGTVELALPLVHAVAARVGPSGLATLEANPTLGVAPDATLRPTSASFNAATPTATPVDTQIAAMDPPAGWTPDAGHGVAVALVDTGVADTPDLNGSRLVRGPDLSGEGDGIDRYGHGTFMAGLIAGNGAASAGLPTRHYGVAPGATLVSVKVAGADGSSSVARVIAGIGWIVTHRDSYGIGVLNLSFGVDAPMPYMFNPLSAAVEAAWASGITVVASAGNEGDGHVTSPGSDPYVITVGAADSAGTVSTANDVVPTWSGRERFPRYSKPDVVAPGVSVVSLRAPGSTVDVTHPEGRVGATYFRGTGTSMSTALVSGAAALLLAHHPAATPDDIKGALVDGASRLAGGAREVDLDRADRADARPDWWQHYRVAFHGLDRGFDNGMPWTMTRWTATRWSATRWSETGWTMSRWTETEWAATRWSATRWSATRWSATRWSAQAWPSQSWG